MTCITTSFKRLYVVRWTKPEVMDVHRILQDIINLHTAQNAPVLYVAIVPPECEPPNDVVRKAIVDTLRALLEHCEVLRMVIEGEAFKRSVMRSVTAGMLLISGKRGKVFIDDSPNVAFKDVAARL